MLSFFSSSSLLTVATSLFLASPLSFFRYGIVCPSCLYLEQARSFGGSGSSCIHIDIYIYIYVYIYIYIYICRFRLIKTLNTLPHVAIAAQETPGPLRRRVSLKKRGEDAAQRPSACKHVGITVQKGSIWAPLLLAG